MTTEYPLGINRFECMVPSQSFLMKNMQENEDSIKIIFSIIKDIASRA